MKSNTTFRSSACLIFLLVYLLGNYSLSAQQKISPAPTPQPKTDLQIAAGVDEADLFWKSRQKYFLVIAANKTAGVGTELPFTKVDGKLISETFTSKGYEQLHILDDKRATRDNVIKRLQEIRKKPDDSVVVIYYSGHAVKDPKGKDLWLQLYGQTEFGDHYGLSISDLIGAARGDSYKGDLVIILDTCYSGLGTVSSQLSLQETERTVIFASSSENQQSYPINSASQGKISAFTSFLLQGLDSDWEEVDADSDGIILFSDLQTYIENKLLERMKDQAILGPMRPQLYEQSPKIWVAYDARYATNLESQQRKNLRLQRLFKIQNPEKLQSQLPDPLPTNASNYHKALKALDEDKYAEAWRLLDIAEGEKKVHLAEIYWARAGVKLEEGVIGSAKDWLEKALEVSPQRNVDLVELTAGINFATGNWARAEELFKEVLEHKAGGKDYGPDTIETLAILAMVNVMQGNIIQGEFYLTKLKSFDSKTLDENEEGFSIVIPMLDILSDIFQGKNENAKKRIAELQKSDESFAGESGEMLRFFTSIINTALNEADSNETESSTITTNTLSEWNDALQKKDINTLTLLLTQVQVATSITDKTKFSDPTQLNILLKSTIDFAKQHKTERRKKVIQAPNGYREIEIDGSEKQSKIESSMLYIGVAIIHANLNEVTQAEKIFKDAIELLGEDKQSMILAVNPLLRLGQIYEEGGRYNEAETLYKSALTKAREQLGEQNTFALMIHEKLGNLYEQQGRWKEAEESYRTYVQLIRSGYGSNSIFVMEGLKELASFLYKQERYSEAMPLFLQIVETLEPKQKTHPWLIEETLGDDYLKLAICYYYLNQLNSAEKTFEKAAMIYSAKKDTNPYDYLSCLIWQWATARFQKKSDEARRFYEHLIELSQTELAKPNPDKSFGSNLQSLVPSFKNLQAYVEGEDILQLILAIQEKTFTPRHPKVAEVWEAIADINFAQGEFGDALTFLRKAKDIYENHTPIDPVKLTNVHFQMGIISYDREEFEQSHTFLQDAFSYYQKIPEDKQSKNQIRFFLGRVQRMMGRLNDAKVTLKSVLETDQNVKQPDLIQIIDDQLELATITRLKREIAESEQWLVQAEASLRTFPQTENIQRGWARVAHEKGMVALANGNIKQAERFLRDAVDKGQNDSQMNAILMIEFMKDYATVLRQKGKKKEAARFELQIEQSRAYLRK